MLILCVLFVAQTRRLVSDFGMMTAISSMVIVAYLFRGYVATDVIVVNPNYVVSKPVCREWFVNPFNGMNSLSVAAGFGALVPALLVSDWGRGEGVAGRKYMR